MSDDGAFGVVVIALLGSPFSPFYARARAAGTAPAALDYAAMNVAVYGPRGSFFSLTERAVRPGAAQGDAVTIGTSRMRWDRGALVIELSDRTSPWGRPLRGTVRLHPEGAPSSARVLDGAGEHLWWPVAPSSSIEVELAEPNVRFRGHGYHDANAGDVPLERSFSRWRWARARLDAGTSAMMYDTVDVDGIDHHLAIAVDRDGLARPIDMPDERPLPRTLWRLPRSTRSSGDVRVLRELEDTPFYARALLESHIEGAPRVTMHEELSCERLRSAWVRFLLGFRMGRQ
ncbi:MAG: carotenoid 1,2-hydratase [Myxococcales bacterium]|nr:carotenoid 1,2-hydratase [Myxococcales bacterium]